MNLKTIRISHPCNGFSFSPFFIAQQTGIFKKFGFNAELLKMSPKDACAALETGVTDIHTSMDFAVRSFVAGSSFRALYVSIERKTFILILNNSIRDLKDLEGKKIGFSGKEAMPIFFLQKFFKENGLNNFEEVYIPSEIARERLAESGEVAASVVEDAHGLRAVKHGKRTITFLNDHPIIGNSLIMRASDVENKPEFVNNLVRAMESVHDFIRKEPARAQNLIKKWIAFDDVDADLMPKIYDCMIKAMTKDGTPSYEAITNTKERLRAGGLSDNLSNFLDFRFIKSFNVERELKSKESELIAVQV